MGKFSQKNQYINEALEKNNGMWINSWENHLGNQTSPFASEVGYSMTRTKEW